MAWSLELDGHVAVLSFVRPPRNLARFADLEQLEGLLGEAAVSGARVVVLTGGIDGYFVGHADLDDLLAVHEGATPSGDGSAWPRVSRALDRGPLLSVAAVNGQAWGGGCELALACNLRWMADDASFSFPEVRLGILPGVGAHRAIQLLPHHVALELIIDGRPVDAAEAHRLGLVNHTTPAGQAREAAVRAAHRLARLPAEAVMAVRDLVVGSGDHTTRELLREQNEKFMALLRSEEAGRLIRAAAARYRDGADSSEAFGYDHGG